MGGPARELVLAVEKPTDTMRYVKTDAMPDFSEGRPYLIWLEAHVKTSDGNEKVISSDGSWKWHDGPLTSSNIYGGEDYDARSIRRAGNCSGSTTNHGSPRRSSRHQKRRSSPSRLHSFQRTKSLSL